MRLWTRDTCEHILSLNFCHVWSHKQFHIPRYLIHRGLTDASTWIADSTAKRRTSARVLILFLLGEGLKLWDISYPLAMNTSWNRETTSTFSAWGVERVENHETVAIRNRRWDAFCFQATSFGYSDVWERQLPVYCVTTMKEGVLGWFENCDAGSHSHV